MNSEGSTQITTTAVADKQSAGPDNLADSSTGDSTGEKPPADATQDAEPPEQKNNDSSRPTSSIAPYLRILLSEPLAQQITQHSLNSEETRKFLHGSITKITTLLKIASGQITINIISDDEMSALHREFCNRDSTTDVLTFDLNENEDEWGDTHAFSVSEPDRSLASRANLRRRSHVDVDLAACADVAIRQDEQNNQTPQKELLLYAVHGLLHCLGHDDHDLEDFNTMHAIEDELLERIGIGAVFSNRTTQMNERNDDSKPRRFQN